MLFDSRLFYDKSRIVSFIDAYEVSVIRLMTLNCKGLELKEFVEKALFQLRLGGFKTFKAFIHRFLLCAMIYSAVILNL